MSLLKQEKKITWFVVTTLIAQPVGSILSFLIYPPDFSKEFPVYDPNGIYDVNAMLEAAMQIMPNPNNGQFDVKFNYHGKIEGDLRVIDMRGIQAVNV